MSIEYYLFCSVKYQCILDYLNGIDDFYYDIINVTQDSKNILKETYDEIFFMECNNTQSINMIKKNVIELKNICDKKILEMCHHEFIDDIIDITPEKSKYITYCEICGFTK
jgi:hypothetical protein